MTGISLRKGKALKPLKIGRFEGIKNIRCPILTSPMSGSPVLQNGKLVGAVTHVLVNDPTRGYAIFIENMLEEMEK